jgi:hypothetical protein
MCGRIIQSSAPLRYAIVDGMNVGDSRVRRPSLRAEVSPINVRDAVEIERAVTAFARSANGGLIATSSAASAFAQPWTGRGSMRDVQPPRGARQRRPSPVLVIGTNRPVARW